MAIITPRFIQRRRRSPNSGSNTLVRVTAVSGIVSNASARRPEDQSSAWHIRPRSSAQRSTSEFDAVASSGRLRPLNHNCDTFMAAWVSASPRNDAAIAIASRSPTRRRVRRISSSAIGAAKSAMSNSPPRMP